MTTMLYEGATVEERVARGEAWLDEHVPGWLDRVVLADLHLQDCQRCVLGQVFQEEAEADTPVFGGAGWDADSGFHFGVAGRPGSWAISHGFDSIPWEICCEDDCCEYDDFQDLQTEWESRIHARQAARVMQDA